MRRLLIALLIAVSLAPLFTVEHAHAAKPATVSAVSSRPPAYSLSPDKLAKAEALERQSNWLWVGGTVWEFISLGLVLALGWAAGLGRIAARFTQRAWVQGLIFVPLLVILLRVLDLPLSLFGHHLGLAYGLSVERWPAWWWDWTKGLLVSLVVMTLVLSLLFAIVRHARRRWWLWFWLLSLPLLLGAVYAEPLIIDPLFNHFEPLSRTHPELVTQLERVVARSGEHIAPDRMFLMKASEKVTGLNAYVTGFGGSKRVVVWDTSLKKATPDEVLFIFGHELGHYVLGDVTRGLIYGAVGLLVALWLASHVVARLITRYGAVWGIASLADWGAVVVLMLVFAVFTFFSDPIANGISRRIEHRADIYGQEIVHGIVADPQETARHSFQTLGEESLDVPDPNRALVFWTYSHPTIADRAAFARDYDPWVPGRHSRFFPR